MSASAPTDAEDLEALFPERTLTLQGEVVTVREFGFIEGLRLTSKAHGLIEALRALASERAQSEDGQDVSLDAILGLLGEHSDELVDLIAIATGESTQWIRNLSDSDGQELLWTFWGVNAGFFSRRIVLGASIDQIRRAQEPSDGQTSSRS